MRKDFYEVIIERPRTKGSKKGSKPKHPKRDLEKLPVKQGIRQAYNNSWWIKSQRDLFNPIHRFLRKRVGRKWNKVYSEICRSHDKRQYLKAHLIRHMVDDSVVLKTWYEDGQIIGHTEGGPRTVENFLLRFYVDPEGVLRESPPYSKKRAPKEENQKAFRLDDGTYYEKIEGIWYRVEYVERETYCYEHGCHCNIPHKVKHQLSKKDLRNLDIKNKKR